MAYYNICPDCGSNLDPGEKCDCQQKEKTPDMPKTYQGKAEKALSSNYSISKAGRTVKHKST